MVFAEDEHVRAVLVDPEQPVDLVASRIVPANDLVAFSGEVQLAARKAHVVGRAARPDVQAAQFRLRVKVDDRDTTAGTGHKR